MPNDPISLNTSGTNFVGNVDGSTTPAVTPKKTTSVKDTTAQAAQADSSTGSSGVSAGSPVLPDPLNMSDADMIALISSALSAARKQRIISQNNKEPIYLTSYVTTVVPKSTSDASGSASVEANATVDTDEDSEVEADVEVKASDDSDDSEPSATTIMGETKVFTALASTLSDAVNDRLEKKLNKKLPHFTMDAIANFLNALVGGAQQMIILPALGALGQVGKVFRTDKVGVDTSTAVQYEKYVLELVDSGQVKSFADKALPGDPKTAAQLATILETILIQSASIQVGNVSGLPGLGVQVNLQATLFRGQQEALGTKSADIIAAALNQVTLPEGVTPAQLSDKITKAVTDALAEGPYTNRDDLLSAIAKQVKLQIPNDETTADAIVAALDQESFAAVTAGSLIFFPSFDQSKINKDTFADSIKQSILIAFAKSQEEVNNASKAKAKADEIVDATLSRSYKSETAFREAVRTEIKAALADQDVTEEQVNQIVAGINIPADPTNPLYDANGAAVIPPWIYTSLVRNEYQKTTHIPPETELGQDFDLVAGIGRGTDGVSTSGLLNEAYAAANTETRSYLNLTPQEATVVAQHELTDPAAVLKNLGNLMNGSLPPDYQQAQFV